VKGDDDVLAVSLRLRLLGNLDEVVADFGDAGKEGLVIFRHIEGMLLAEAGEERGACRNEPDGAGIAGDEGVVAALVLREGTCDRDHLDDRLSLRDKPGIALDAEVRAEGGGPDRPLDGEEGGDIRVERLALVEGEEEDAGDEAAGAREDDRCGGDVSSAGHDRNGEEGDRGKDEGEGPQVGMCALTCLRGSGTIILRRYFGFCPQNLVRRCLFLKSRHLFQSYSKYNHDLVVQIRKQLI